MPQCQFPVFCCFCISEKLYRKYSRNWMKQKPKSIFYRNEDEVRRGVKRRTRAPRPPLGAAWAWPAPRVGVGPPGTPPTWILRLFIHLLGKTLDTRASIHEKFRRGCHRRTHLGEFWSSSRHPAGGGNHRRRHLHRHARLRSDAWVVHPWTMGP